MPHKGAWDESRKEIVRVNGVLEAYEAKIKALKASVDEAELPRLDKELKTLKAAKRRHDDETVAVITKLEGHEAAANAVAFLGLRIFDAEKETLMQTIRYEVITK